MRRLNIFVTVGMGRWPFDRLISAIEPLCEFHCVTAQIGTSRIRPSCRHDEFLSFEEFKAGIGSADVVITHAGNTVRLVQRCGLVPIAVAREQRRREMRNNHQVAFLRHEEQIGRVVGVWDTRELPDVVARHAETAAKMLVDRPLPPRPSPDQLIATMDALCGRLLR